LVRHLNKVGPVVAINPPGTRLAPLGAARETLADDAWRNTVKDWMAAARLIVFAAPPGAWTPGLLWELEQVRAAGLWSRTLIVTPPMPAEHLQWRWNCFAASLPEGWPLRMGLPADPADVLAVSFNNGEVAAITARQRNEWTYAAALQAAVRLPVLVHNHSHAMEASHGQQVSGQQPRN